MATPQPASLLATAPVVAAEPNNNNSNNSSIQKTGYTGFGSFHSGDVEVLIRQDEQTYKPPPLPFADPADQPHNKTGPICSSRNANSNTNPSTSNSSSSSSSGFGAAARQHFLIDFDRWCFINHGAFGGVSRAAAEAADCWRTHCEAQPLNFIDRELFPQLVRVIRELAAFVNCRPQDVVLLPNATTGLNAVISSMRQQLKPGDAVFSLDIGYGSVKKMLRAACDATGADMVTATVTFPISGPEAIISLVESSLPPTTRLAVFDAVTSNTALVLPVQELVHICRSRGIPVLVDAAHALGMLPIDLQQLQPDFFVSNCHKWLCGARGTAMMFVAPQWQHLMQPPVLSHGAEASGFLSRFIWDGCRDYAPLLAVGSAVKWWRGLEGVDTAAAAAAAGGGGGGDVEAAAAAAAAVSSCSNSSSSCCDPSQLCHPGDGATAAAAGDGGEAAAAAAAESACSNSSSSCCDPSQLCHPGDGGASARCYMFQLCRSAAALLSQRWGTECLGPGSMTAAMVLVRLPEGGLLPARGAAGSDDAKYIQDLLHSSYSIEVPVKTIQGTLYVRISSHIYNTLQDYVKLAEAVEELKAKQPPGS